MSLLASVDAETIDGDIIHELRELAKKAIWLRIDFEPRFEAASAAMAAEAGYVSDAEPGKKEAANGRHNTSSIVGSEADVSSVQEPEAEQILDDVLIDEDVPDTTTKATLDMIVTIVGEVFGQRDLLELREVVDWPVRGRACFNNNFAWNPTYRPSNTLVFG